MNTETLRQAAEKIRRELCYGGSGHPFYAAIADWLDESADHLEVVEEAGLPSDLLPHVCPTALEGLDCSVLGQSLTVARAYLGESV